MLNIAKDDQNVCINHGIRQDIIPIIATVLVWPQKNTTEQQQRELNLCLKETGTHDFEWEGDRVFGPWPQFYFF